MLRLPPFRYHRPRTVAEAAAILAKHGPDAMPIAGGTDLMPNMKHRLFTPAHVVSLNGIEAMRGIGVVQGGGTGAADGASGSHGGESASGVRPGAALRIGALETLHDISAHAMVRRHFHGLATAAGLVAGPQLRNMGTIGGNICLDTRCTYYNQTHFWRSALGYCLKKDGDVCHVTGVGRKCVAAHSADTPPNLIALGAAFTLAGPRGEREVAAADFFVTDGIWNTRRAPGEILTEIRIPLAGPGFGPGRNGGAAPPDGARPGAEAGALRLRSAYRKLRQRNSIDFPLLSVAVAGALAEDGTVAGLRGVVSALGARPRVLDGWGEIAAGRRLDDEVVDALAERARAQCRPLDNIIVDAEWRRAMIPVQVRRALGELAGG